jgi:ATP-binding cassette subfamily F protein 3
VGVLSGGEKARLALAKMLLRPVNLLVLDEPTNHLDVDACEVLEEALRAYAGTFVVISHDRAFLNALATRVVEVRAGVLREFPGNYDAYLKNVSGEAAGGLSAGRPGAVAGHGMPHGVEAVPAAATTATPPPSKEARIEAREALRERRKTREKTARRLAQLEGEIAEKEKAIEAVGWQLAEPEVYKDGDRMRALDAERTAAKAAVDALYREWERLGAELEALDAVLAEAAG